MIRQRKLFQPALFCFLIFALLFRLPTCLAQVLPIQQAFAVHVLQQADKSIQVRWQIAPNHHLYQDTIKVNQAVIKRWPQADPHTDALGHKRAVYHNEVTLHVILDNPSTHVVTVTFQGCQGNQQCYPPQTLHFNVKPDQQWHEPNMQQTHDAGLTELSVTGILGFLVAGLLLSFTPCVLPMLPILASLLFTQGETSQRKQIQSALLYVLAMSLSYATAGMFAASLGYSLQASLQSPFIVGGFGLVLLALGLSMCLEVSWPNRTFAPNVITGQWYSPILLGATAMLVTSPCTTPAFIGAMTYVAKTGNQWLGAINFFALGLGMGLPLLALAAFGKQVIPNTGPWMKTCQKLTGVLLVVTAVWISAPLLSPILPGQPTRHSLGTSIGSRSELNQAIQKGSDNHQTLILNFTASWCTTCTHLDHSLFSQKSALSQQSDLKVLHIDISHPSSETTAIMKQFHVIAPPTLIIIRPNHTQQQLVGDVKLADLLKLMR